MKKIWLGTLSAMLFVLSAQAADFKWMDDQGKIYNLAESYKNQPIVVHFWASWCPPCVAEMPEMVAWLKEHPQVKLLPVSLDNSLEKVQSFLQKNQINLPALLTDNSQSGRMGVRGLPTTILIDQHGKVLAARIGMQDWQQHTWTDQLLALFSNGSIQKTVPIKEIARTEHH